MGTASAKDKRVIVTVFIMAGSIETFSLLYSRANREGFKLGMPLISIYATIITTTAAVITAAPQVIKNIIKEAGRRL